MTHHKTLELARGRMGEGESTPIYKLYGCAALMVMVLERF